MKLILPFPPSVNTYWRHPNKGAFAGKSLISEAGRKFQSAACAAIVEQLRRLPKPTSAPASVEIVLFPPDNRIRDLDNYNKALFDALTHAGVWEDDRQVKRMLVEWGPVIPKQYGIRLTANQAYHQMVKLGIVEQRERYSRTAINNIKKFWSLTAKGCMFGKNITSPANPRETQPHFFESRFPELLKLLDTVH